MVRETSSRRRDRRNFLLTPLVMSLAGFGGESLLSSAVREVGQDEPRIPRDVQPAYPQDLTPEKTREKLLELLGVELPPSNLEFDQEGPPETTSDGLQITRLRYRNSLGEEVPGALVLPSDAASKSLPGIVCMSGTGGDVERLIEPRFQRDQPGQGPLRGWARELARRGFATLSITLRGTVTRRSSVSDWERHIRFLIPYGRTIMGVMVGEALRAARILSANPAVQPSRIGLTGMSLGGNVSWYGMACDPSIRTAVPVAGSVASLAALIHDGDTDRHSSYIYIPHLLRYFDHPQIVARCICPRPFMVIAPTRDEDMPRQGVDKMARLVHAAYRAAGHPRRFKVYQPDSNHVYKRQYFEWMAAWFEKHC